MYTLLARTYDVIGRFHQQYTLLSTCRVMTNYAYASTFNKGLTRNGIGCHMRMFSIHQIRCSQVLFHATPSSNDYNVMAYMILPR